VQALPCEGAYPGLLLLSLFAVVMSRWSKRLELCERAENTGEARCSTRLALAGVVNREVTPMVKGVCSPVPNTQMGTGDSRGGWISPAGRE